MTWRAWYASAVSILASGTAPAACQPRRCPHVRTARPHDLHQVRRGDEVEGDEVCKASSRMPGRRTAAPQKGSMSCASVPLNVGVCTCSVAQACTAWNRSSSDTCITPSMAIHVPVSSLEAVARNDKPDQCVRQLHKVRRRQHILAVHVYERQQLQHSVPAPACSHSRLVHEAPGERMLDVALGGEQDGDDGDGADALHGVSPAFTARRAPCRSWPDTCRAGRAAGTGPPRCSAL